MPIVLRHEAAGIPAGQNPNRKYGQSMVLQQQQADQNMRLRAQDAQYDMQRIGAMAQMRQPSIGEDASMLDQEIRSGLYDPDTVRALRDDERMIGEIMRDRRIDYTQRAKALENIQSRMRMMRATGKRMEPKMQSTIPGGAPPLTQSPKTPQQAFREDPKLAEKYMAMVTEQETNAGVTLPLKEKVARALALYSEYQSALADPTDEKDGQQPAAQQPNAPAQNAPPPPPPPPGSPSGKAPAYIPIAPGGGRQQGSGQVGESQQSPVYSPDGKFLGDPRLYDQAGANYIRQQVSPPAPPSQLPPSGRPGLDAAVGNNMDTIYDLANMDRSAGTNYFDPENPAYAAMRGPDQSILNTAQNTGRFMGRYGLGGIDYGINPATGNRVTASIRPGGTMPEYDEPVGPPGTAMGGRKGSVTWKMGRKQPEPMMSPGGTPVSPSVVQPKTQPSPAPIAQTQMQAPATPTVPIQGGYQYQSPVAQTVSGAINAPQPSVGMQPTGRTFTSVAGREVEAAMNAGEEIASRQQQAEQQSAVQAMTAPPPKPMSDEERKKLGLPTRAELEGLRGSIDQNTAMGGIGLGGTGRPAGSYEPTKAADLQKGKQASAAQQKKSAPKQMGMSKTLAEFASKQPPDVQKAIEEAYNTRLSDRLRENAIRFLLSKNIDLEKML